MKKFTLLAFLGILFVLPMTVLVLEKQQITDQHAAGGFPHVVGIQVVDANGTPMLLRGTQIQSELNIGWVNGSKVSSVLNPQVFQAIHNWQMNVLRLPIGAYNYQKPNYMTILDQVVTQANQAGLYVILGNFEDAQAGGGSSELDQQGLAMWQFMAQHYKNNPMVMFDLINEPHPPDWNTLLNGGNGVIGLNTAISAIRAVGAQQIIVVQAGSAGGGKTGWATFQGGITDPNVIYTLHFYEQIAQGNPTTWNQAWGLILGKHPLYFGEWAMLPHPNHPIFCQGVTSATAYQATTAFLQYMDSIHAHWTAWSFTTSHLIQDETSFTPTNFQTGAPWTCPNGVGAGMGQVVKNYLANTSVPSSTGNPSTSPHPTGTTMSFSLCPHGLGNCGDNANAQGGGNTNPQHPTRNITVTVLNSQNQQIATGQGNVTYDQTTQKFSGSIPFSNLASGQYIVTVKMDGYLTKQILGIITITSGQTTTLPSGALITGDINNDNQLDILDYNLLIGCFGTKVTTSSCQNKTAADLTDDGSVDGADYNLFLRELSVQKGI